MNWLIWREYRLNRLILIAGVTILLLPYLIALIVLLWPKSPAFTAFHVTKLFAGAALYSLALSQVTLALLGGNAIACERADRSAEFIAYLPLLRKRLLCGKLILTFSAVAFIWAINSLVLWVAVNWIPKLQPNINEPYKIACNIAITGFVFYGVSWFISSFQSSPTFAVGGGLIAPLLVFMVLLAMAGAMDLKPKSFGQFMGDAYAIICPILALICFSIGTWYYLKRVEP